MEFRRRDDMKAVTASSIRRALQYAFYDWKREMPRSRRFLITAGFFIQTYALYAMWTRSLIWPVMWPPFPFLIGSVWLLYLFGSCLTNVVLTLEFLRKTQLESDQIAAREIQRTLYPQSVEKLPGYELEMFYDPVRDVGGDYIDVISLPDNRRLFALADVSGKGAAAALLAANLQALVRTISSMQPDLQVLAQQINEHLSRYTPANRFATAVFLVLSPDSGTITYVNAGHNAPILLHRGSDVLLLEATGLPLGLFAGARYEQRTNVIPHGCTLVLFTDGLPDSILADSPDLFLHNALAENAGETMSKLKSFIDPARKEDDITIFLIERT